MNTKNKILLTSAFIFLSALFVNCGKLSPKIATDFSSGSASSASTGTDNQPGNVPTNPPSDTSNPPGNTNPPGTSQPPPSNNGGGTAVPIAGVQYLDKLNSLMNTYGRQYCNAANIANVNYNSVEAEGNVWYYDGTYIYQNMAKFTGDNSWYACADEVVTSYRNWVNTLNLGPSQFLPNGDYRPLLGYRLFPFGLEQHYARTNQVEDKQALIRLATKSALLTDWDGYSVANLPDCLLSRETAYLIDSFLTAKNIGIDQGPKINQAIEFALGHLDQMFVAKTCQSSTDANKMMQPFMVGLTTEALILAYERIPDTALRARILAKIQIAMDELWKMAWNPAQKSMYANTMSKTEYWPVMNVMLAASYVWLWQITGNEIEKIWADQLWEGAMTMDYSAQIHSGKQYSQIFRRAFDYIKWRGAPSGTYPVPTKY